MEGRLQGSQEGLEGEGSGSQLAWLGQLEGRGTKEGPAGMGAESKHCPLHSLALVDSGGSPAPGSPSSAEARDLCVI